MQQYSFSVEQMLTRTQCKKTKTQKKIFFKPWMVVEKEKQFFPTPFLLFNMLIRGIAPRNPNHETSSSENYWQSFCVLIITSLLLSWADVDLCKRCYSWREIQFPFSLLISGVLHYLKKEISAETKHHVLLIEHCEALVLLAIAFGKIPF